MQPSGAQRAPTGDSSGLELETRVVSSVGLETRDHAANRAPTEGSPSTRVLSSASTGGTRGRFVVLEMLGRGGMGAVFRAYDPTLRREVALKVLASDRFAGELMGRLVREAQAIARVSHPNVVAVYDVTDDTGIADVADGMASVGEISLATGNLVLAMEYVPGQTLRSWLGIGSNTPTRRPWTEVLNAFRAAAQGLAAAHRAGLVHLDFKPANVLVSEDGRVVVTDFGLAMAPSERADLDPSWELGETLFDTAVGTPKYMAPEQHRGQEVDARTDQYAFCLALWEALCGFAPFAAGDLDVLEAAKSKGPPAWPKHVRVPPNVVAAIERGLAPQITARWPSMQALLAALETTARRRYLLSGAFALPVLATSVPLLWSWYVEREQRCSGADEQLKGVWDEGRRAAVEAALLATHLSYAAQTWRHAEAALDDYARDWRNAYGSSCEATVVDGTQSEAVMNLRLGCLHRRKVELRSVVNVLTQADAQVLEKTMPIISGLPPLSRCSDVEALQAEIAPPDSPDDAAKVTRARDVLSMALVEQRAGRFSSALQTLELAEKEVAGVEYAPVHAELMLRKGSILDREGKYREAEESLRRAMSLAVGSGVAETSHVASTLATVVGRQGRLSEGLWLSKTAITLAVADDDGRLEAAARNERSLLLWAQGQFAEAEAESRQAIALLEEARGPNCLEVSDLRSNLGSALAQQGRFAEAEAEHRQALALRDQIAGSEHPRAAEMRNNLAVALHEQGRHEEAESESRRVIEILQKSVGADHPSVAISRTTLGIILSAQKRYAEAEAEYRQSAAFFEKAMGPNHPNVAFVEHKLGEVLALRGRNDEARQHLERALEIRSGGPVPAFQRAETALALAKVLWATNVDQPRALLLADQAIAGYAAAGAVMRNQLREAQQWLLDRRASR